VVSRGVLGDLSKKIFYDPTGHHGTPVAPFP
jgi:hypothetical protein